MNKAVTKADSKAVSAFTSEFEDFGAEMGSGFENVTAADILIPRLTILQGLSPQVTQGKPEYDKDAKVGMIYDVGLQEGFNEGVQFLPVHYVKQWLEWAPRSSGKGLISIHNSEEILQKTERDDKNRPVLPNGNYIAETAQIYGMNVTADYRKSFIPMTSTQLKKARRLMTLAMGQKLTNSRGQPYTPPLFYRTYLLTTVPESNNEGNWMGWKIEPGPAMDELPNWQSLMQEVKDFRDALTKGDIAGDIASMAEEAGQVVDHDSGAM